MEEVRENISRIVTLADDCMTKLMAKLQAMGVSGVDDLCVVKVEDLTPEVLLPIPARKLVRAWETLNDAATRENALSLHTPPAPNAAMPTAASPVPMPLTPRSSSESNCLNWVRQFDLTACMNNMRSQVVSHASRQAATLLCDGLPLSQGARNEVVRVVVDSILKLSKAPARSSMSAVAEMMVEKYGQLKDQINGQVVGTGYTSLRNQLENRITYLNRPAAAQRRNDAVKRRKPNSDCPPQKIRDGYGCIDFLPVSLPHDETPQTLSDKHTLLKQLYTKQPWNETEVSGLMAATYYIQRQDLVGPMPLTVAEVNEEWPFLAEPKWMFEHLARLLGINLPEKMEQGLLEKKTTLMKYFTAKATGTNKLGKRLAEMDISIESPVVLIQLLMVYFEENESVLFISVEVMIALLPKGMDT